MFANTSVVRNRQEYKKIEIAKADDRRRKRFATYANVMGTHAGLPYKKARLIAKPVWSDPGDGKIINALYQAAKLLTRITGTLYTIDHVIPLRGKNVCGLHTPGNLRVVEDRPNSLKGNDYASS